MDATAIEGWKEYARTRTGDLGALVARDAVFESPVVHSPVVGRDAVVTYLAGALVAPWTGQFVARFSRRRFMPFVSRGISTRVSS